MIKFIVRVVVYNWILCMVAFTANINGRYTKSLRDYHLSIPHAITHDGEFLTFHLPRFHDHRIESYKERKKRSLYDSEMIHYGFSVGDQLFHLQLWPNRAFLHPNLVFEKRDPEINIKDRYVRTLKDKRLCHYTGRVKGIPKSRAAISTCDGLAGYLVVGNNTYFIEPVDDHSPNSEGHHLHVVYNKVPKDKTLSCGTHESWEDAMKKRFREQLIEGKDIFKVKRGLAGVGRYLEIAVICDKKFLQYHKSRDVELYVMTIMNMVADYYHDASVGRQMDIVVVRIIYLEKEEKEIDLIINRDASKTLRSFCDWAIKVNTPEDSVNHYDMAILLTRMGADHDEQSNPCSVQDTDGSYFVMSPIVSTYTIRWSSCSRNMINTLLENNLGDCLIDSPESIIYPFTDNMPGVVYDSNEQCKYMLPASLGVCSGLKEKICENLICKISKKECVGKDEIAADGTKCAENKWCFKRKCIEMGERPEAVNGGWGDWGQWVQCTRNCGGGITYSERECNNPVPANKGKFCLGERRKIKICNTGPCPDDAPTFRQEQCSEQDVKPWNNEYHTWTASFQEDKPCALYCVNEEHVLSELEAVIKDGTSCKHGTKNKCIAGVCRVVGCDNILDSEAVEDHCGICNGDGTQCKIVEDTYKDVGQGYTKVVVIPAGVRKVIIEEKAPSTNIIAISDSSEAKFYLNGDNTENLDGEYNFGTTIGVYTHVEPTKERLVIDGPVKEDLVLFVVFFAEENTGYTYRWAEPSVDSSYEPRYYWEIGELGDCDVLCGGGSQVASINCIEERGGKVSANFCAGMDKPGNVIKNCNEEPCKKKWKVGTWGQCRACKNKSGVRIRDVECVQENPKVGADDILIEDAECEGPKPGTVELCNASHKCGRKRMTSFIPGKYQENVWTQMNRKYIRKKQSVDHSSKQDIPVGSTDDTILESNDDSSPGYPFKGKLGKMIHDFRPMDEEILVKYTIKTNPLKKNLSDKAYAQMGDEVGDVIDTENKVIFRGKEAAKLIHELQQPRNGSININCHKKGNKHQEV